MIKITEGAVIINNNEIEVRQIEKEREKKIASELLSSHTNFIGHTVRNLTHIKHTRQRKNKTVNVNKMLKTNTCRGINVTMARHLTAIRYSVKFTDMGPLISSVSLFHKIFQPDL